VTSCARRSFVDKVDEEPSLRHLGQPELALAVDGARKRKVGEAWLWHRRDTSVDISPLQALTLAVYGLKEERPKKEVRPHRWPSRRRMADKIDDGDGPGRHRPGQRGSWRSARPAATASSASSTTASTASSRSAS
jgi:hypothetical protein